MKFRITALTRPSLVLCAYLTLPMQPACVHPAPSQVAERQRYVSGDSEFDAFFSRFHALERDVASGPEDEQRFREKLARALDSAQPATASALARTVRSRVENLARTRVFLRLEVDDETEATAQAEVVLSGRRPPASATEFLQALSRTVRDETRLSLRMSRIRRELEQLHLASAGLKEKVDSKFRVSGLKKKAEVRNNLKDAIARLPNLIARAEETHEVAEKAVRKLTDATHIEISALGGSFSIRPDEALGNGAARGASGKPGPGAKARIPPREAAKSNRALASPGASEAQKSSKPSPPPADFEP